AERCGDIRDAREYSAMARRQATRNQPVLIIMCGLSGSGKTWLAERLMAALPAIRVRSDIERKRLFGLEETAGSGSGIGEGIYSAAASEATYKRLFKLARSLLKARHHVVLDAAFLKKDLRQAARELAADTGRRSVLVHADAPANVLKQRIDRRVALKDEASEADIAVLDHQLETSDELTEDEARINVDTSRDIDIDALAATILECRNR
ncbi:MAG: ATP-binding protein, partial [Gammaproteobacteria bacterium]|nr:ATP-binding protein [Gammaproteobacteria bacterium]